MKEIRGNESPTGFVPDFGAIFMSSKSTKKECLQKKLFGLPAAFNSFVKHVKAGMLLFLFEYETRQLYGVFEAASDGAIGIMPNAYRSSGKKFPAQVKIKTVWNCQPLLEDEFFVAIEDNYFQAFKFNFGLSKDQVYHLLRLFHQKREWTEKPHELSTQHAYQEEQTDDFYLEDHVSTEYTRTGCDISTVCMCSKHDELFTGKEDPIFVSKSIPSSGAPVTKKIDSISYYQPYDPDRPYIRQFSTRAQTGFMPFMSGACSHSPICFEGRSDELQMVSKEVDYSMKTKNLELEEFIPLESSPCTQPYSSTTRTLNPDFRQATSPSSRQYRYSEPYHNCGLSPHLVREKVASHCQTDRDEEFIYEASEREATVGTRSQRLSVLEETDGVYVEGHFRNGCTKEFELGNYIPLDTSPYTRPYYPTTRIPYLDCRQASFVSSGHCGFSESVHECRFGEKGASSSHNDEDQEFTYEVNDRIAKAGARSKKRSSVFSRLSFAPEYSRASDFNNGLSNNESTHAIMEHLQRKHANWSKEFSRKKFGHEESSRERQDSVCSKLRLMLYPIKQDSEGVMKTGATVKILKTNSGQREKWKLFDKLDSLVAKGISSVKTFESNSSQAEKVGTKQFGLESSSSTQKQSKRRKLIKPVFGLGSVSKECVTHPNHDSQLPCEEDQVSKREVGNLLAPAESACVSSNGVVEESVSLVGEGKVSCMRCEDSSDEMTAKEAVREVLVEDGSNGCLTSGEPETQSIKVLDHGTLSDCNGVLVHVNVD